MASIEKVSGPGKKGAGSDNGVAATVERSPRRRRLLAWYDEHWMLLGSLTILIGAAASISLLWLIPAKLAAVGTGSLCILIFTTIGLNMLSDDEDLSSGEVQKAITFAVLFGFFGLLAFPTEIARQTENLPAPGAVVLEAALQHFWIIVLTVVGFYFGGRIIDQIREVPALPGATLLQEALWEIRKKVRQGQPIGDLLPDIKTLGNQLANVNPLQPKTK